MLPPPTPIFITSQKVDAHVKPVIEFNSAMKKKGTGYWWKQQYDKYEKHYAEQKGTDTNKTFLWS